MSKLLLVEDDNNLREIYEARLQAEGYTIVTAKDGEEALAVSKSEKPDLIISDVMMPKISGFEMLDILKNTDGLKNVKIIMLTALGQSDDQQRADKLGADRYLVKSQVTLEDIVRVTHELLEDGGEAPAAAVATADTSVATPISTPAAATPAPATPTVATEPSPALSVAPEPEPTPAVTTDKTAEITPPEPVAPAPTTPDPEPVPAPEPSTPAKTSSDDSADQAMSTSEESANIESQIEDFVEGATSDAPTPAEEANGDLPTPTTVSTPESTTASGDSTPITSPPSEPATPAVPAASEPVTPTSSSSASVAAADDKLMDDAVKSLTNEPSTPKPPPNPTPSATATTTTASTLATEPPAEPPVLEETAPAEEEDKPSPSTNGSTMSHEKVIKPPANSQVNNKPDIEALLIAEQAKEAAVTQVTPAPPSTTVTPSTTQPASAEQPVDPNSIAL